MEWIDMSRADPHSRKEETKDCLASHSAQLKPYKYLVRPGKHFEAHAHSALHGLGAITDKSRYKQDKKP